MGYRLRSIGDRQSANRGKARIGGQVAEIGVGGSVKQVRNLVLDKVNGIGVDAVIDHGGAAANHGFLFAKNTTEQTVLESGVEGKSDTRREIVAIGIVNAAGIVGFAAQVVAEEWDGGVSVNALSGCGEAIV